jgi:biopolymer transport protein ExbD
MRRKRNTKLLIEPPASATGDIAFNLIVFFLVCAAVQPDRGRPQTIPRSEQNEQKSDDEHIELQLKRTTMLLNGNVIRDNQLLTGLKNALAGKPRPEDKVVVLKSDQDVDYKRWIEVTMMIDEAGGMLTIQREEERTVQVP